VQRFTAILSSVAQNVKV